MENVKMMMTIMMKFNQLAFCWRRSRLQIGHRRLQLAPRHTPSWQTTTGQVGANFKGTTWRLGQQMMSRRVRKSPPHSLQLATTAVVVPAPPSPVNTGARLTFGLGLTEEGVPYSSWRACPLTSGNVAPRLSHQLRPKSSHKTGRKIETSDDSGFGGFVSVLRAPRFRLINLNHAPARVVLELEIEFKLRPEAGAPTNQHRPTGCDGCQRAPVPSYSNQRRSPPTTTTNAQCEMVVYEGRA